MHHVNTNLSKVKKKITAGQYTCIQMQIFDFEVKVQGQISLTRAYDPMFYNQTHRDQIS